MFLFVDLLVGKNGVSSFIPTNVAKLELIRVSQSFIAKIQPRKLIKN